MILDVDPKIVISGTHDRPFVYAGGPVDYAHREATHQWRHDLAEMSSLAVYCPICANADHPDIDTIMRRNELALLKAERAVFLLDGRFTVGTPIEIALRVEHRHPSSVAIVHTAGEPGVFVKVWARMGVLVLPSWEGMPQWLGK